MVTTEALSSSAFGSAEAVVTVAALVIVPAAAGWTTSVSQAAASLASDPTLQVTTPAALLTLPCVALAPASTTPPGKVSVTTTLVALAGP